MPKCANKGCGKDYEDDANTEESCIYHPGGPVCCAVFEACDLPRDVTALQVFHEGLKSWSCCNTVNKPVLTFDEFMALPVRSLPDLIAG